MMKSWMKSNKPNSLLELNGWCIFHVLPWATNSANLTGKLNAPKTAARVGGGVGGKWGWSSDAGQLLAPPRPWAQSPAPKQILFSNQGSTNLLVLNCDLRCWIILIIFHYLMNFRETRFIGSLVTKSGLDLCNSRWSWTSDPSASTSRVPDHTHHILLKARILKDSFMSDLAFTRFLLKITDSFCQRTTSGLVNRLVLFKRASRFLGWKIRDCPSPHNTQRAEHPAVCANVMRAVYSRTGANRYCYLHPG